MKKPFCALIVLVLLGLPGSARALEVDQLIALTAMPLVVAEASELPQVPQDELMNVITTLNNALVPPTQFVEVIRYAPVALVAPAEPRFSTYVTTEYARGVVGEPLAVSIADRYPTYGVREVQIVDPPVMTYVERETILPDMVVTRFSTRPADPLALIAMPLAVAAVAELVPRSDLVSLVTALNQAMMPAPQFVEVVRYSPVVLVDRQEAPRFLSYVTTEVDRGVVGQPLALALADRIGIDQIDNPPVLVEPVTRVVRTSSHPHGGPPGQLKKELGLQTGAEVVHGSAPRSHAVAHARKRAPVDDEDHRVLPVRRTVKVPHGKKVDHDVVPVTRPAHVNEHPGKANVSQGHGGGGGQPGNSGKPGNSGHSGGGKGKGKGKG
jgi:uncharacterized membrane protein YgcG